MEKPNFGPATLGNNENREKAPKAKFRLRLHIIRHGKKAGGNDVTPEVDMAMTLKPEGRLQGRQKGIALETKGGAASGSTRARARETAMHMVNANNPEITGGETYAEMVEKVRIPWINTALDMPFSKDDPEFGTINDKANEGTLFTWFTEQDDEIAREGGDRSKSFYGIQAGEIASLVERFARVATKMADREERAKAKGEEADTEREQVMGTHGGVNESFLAEVVRRTLGEEERKRFVGTIPNGVGETQGSDIDIVATSGESEPSIHMKFLVGKEGNTYEYNRDVPLQVVREIVRDFSPKEKTEGLNG